MSSTCPDCRADKSDIVASGEDRGGPTFRFGLPRRQYGADPAGNQAQGALSNHRGSVAGGLAVDAAVGGTVVDTGLRIDPDRVGIALTAAVDLVSHRAQFPHCRGVLVGSLEADLVGEPGMMHSWS